MRPDSHEFGRKIFLQIVVDFLLVFVKLVSVPNSFGTFWKNIMKRITRKRNLTPEEAAKYQEALRQEEPAYPNCYLHVLECRSGETFITPLRGNASLDITYQVKKWIKKEFGGELFLDGELTPKLEGDYYAKIMTGAVCWDSGGFYLTNEK